MNSSYDGNSAGVVSWKGSVGYGLIMETDTAVMALHLPHHRPACHYNFCLLLGYISVTSSVLYIVRVSFHISLRLNLCFDLF